MSTQEPQQELTGPKSIRLYSSDYKELLELHGIIKKLNRKMDVNDLVRDCVQAGLPVIQKRWGPLANGINSGNN